MQFYKRVKKILEAIEAPPPVPPAIIQHAQDTKLTFDDVYAFIKHHEGFKNTVYKDSVGIPTIGIGFNLLRPDARKIINNMGINYEDLIAGNISLSDDQVKEIFKITLNIAYHDAKKWLPNFDGLPKNVKLVILDLSFNLGYPRLSKFVKTREHIINGNFDLAAAELQSSKWATQVGKRASSLIKLLAS